MMVDKSIHKELFCLDKDGHFYPDGRMKEQVYGWYPPANDVWKTYRAGSSSYRKECTYKHWNSKYNDHDGVATPQPPTPLRISSALRSTNSRRATSPTRSAIGSPQKQDFKPDLQITGHSSFVSPTVFRPASQTDYHAVVRPSPPPSAHKTRPVKMWAMKVPSTQLSHAPQPPSKVRESVYDSPLPPSSTGRPERTQSATVARHRMEHKPRNVHSAGTIRSPPLKTETGRSTPSKPREPLATGKKEERTKEECPKQTEEGPEDEDNDNAAEKKEDEEEENKEEEEMPLQRPSSPVLDYDEQLEKHGWRMEVPGDPLNLKTPCLSKRGPFVYKCEMPTIRPPPPKTHVQNYDTYFYNTIPQRPMSFVIHKEWVSEVLNAKRLDLQKREGGINYRWKNFSFVY